MFVNTIHIDKLFPPATWKDFIKFCEERLYISYVKSRKNLLIAWHLSFKKVGILQNFQRFFQKQNINSGLTKVQKTYALRIYNIFDIKYIFEKLSEVSSILKKKIESYWPIIEDKIKNGGGWQHLKPLQIKYIIKLYREGESIETIEKITKHSQLTITTIVKKEFNIKPKYMFMGKQIA